MITSSSWLGIQASDCHNQTLPLPAGIRLLAGIRGDLQHLDPTNLEARIIVRNWWESGGHLEYPHIEWPITSSDVQALHARPTPDALCSGGHGLSTAYKGTWPTILDFLPCFAPQTREFEIAPEAVLENLPLPLAFVWSDRPDLQALHKIDTAAGRLSYLKWWLLYGHREYVRLKWELSDQWRDLDFIDEISEVPLPKFVRILVEARPDLQHLLTSHSDLDHLKCLHWWANHGAQEYPAPSWNLNWLTPLKNRIKYLAASFETERLPIQNRPAKSLPYFAYMARQMRPDLIAAFDTKTLSGCDQLLSWWSSNGQNEFKHLSELAVDTQLEVPGINVVGYAQSVIGIAEDVRMAVKSAEAAGLAVCVIDVPMPGPNKCDNSLNHLMVSDPAHPVSLYCLPPSETYRLGMESKTRLLNSGTYNIAGWHWELPSWPIELGGVTSAVDEIWVYTEFVKNAFKDLAKVPVIKLPLAVELPKFSGRNRALFELAKERFLFLVMFDGNSWLTRKNPIAAVKAFKMAFANNPHVGLVIKTISLNRASAGWQAVEREIGSDERISIIETTLDRPGLTQLMASCDAYVSLHRSEGFGRIIAEAMLLGIPTVTTNFSGNTEFCKPETSYLVDGPLVSLGKSDYLFAEGQHWCDPDIAHAAQQMLRLVEDKVFTDHLVTSARSNIEMNFSPQAAGSAYKKRLEELRSNGKI